MEINLGTAAAILALLLAIAGGIMLHVSRRPKPPSEKVIDVAKQEKAAADFLRKLNPGEAPPPDPEPPKKAKPTKMVAPPPPPPPPPKPSAKAKSKDEQREAEFQEALAKLEKLNSDLTHKNEELSAIQSSLSGDLKKKDRLIDLTQSLTQTLELKTLLGTMLKKVREILVFHSGGIFLYNQDKTELHVAATEGFYEEEMATQLGPEMGIPAIVAQTNKSLIFADTESDPRFTTINKTTRIHSAIYYPISQSKTVYGVICLWNMDTNAFSDKDLEILATVTSEAARAIKNAEIYQELDSRLNFIVTLWDTSKNLTSSVDIASAAWEKVLDEVLTSILNLFGSEKAAFLRYDSKRKELVPAIAHDISETGLVELAKAANTCGLGLPFFLHNTFQVKEWQKDPRFSTFYVIAAAEELLSVLWAPLMGRQMTIGALALFSSQPRTWTQMELQWVDIFANMFSMTLENIFLFQDLASEKSQLQVLIDNMPEGVFTTDASGRVLTWNAAAQRITGWNLSQMVNHPCSEFIKCQTVDEVWCLKRCPLRISMDTQAKYDSGMNNVFVLTKEGENKIPVFITSAPIYNDEGKIAGSILVFRDITKEKEIEQMKEDFLATITHDLKSPLASVMGYAELMLNPKMGSVTSSQKEFLEAIMRSSKTLQFLIDNILEITRMEAGKMLFHPIPFNLEGLIGEIHEMFRPLAAPKSLQLEMSVDSTLVVNADRDKIKEIFINLYANAIKFTPQKGVIATTVIPEESIVTIKVSDTGKGIAADQLSRLFQKFAQVKGDERRGTGLGLYIVKRILQAHGEDVRVESELGKGTTFIFNLPQAGSETPNGRGNSQTVLILERDRLTSEVCKRVLEEDGGLAAIEAATATDVLKAMFETPPRVVVIDSRVPEVHAGDFLTRLRSISEEGGQSLRILLICDWREEVPADADSHIFRPVEPAELLRKVKGLMGT